MFLKIGDAGPASIAYKDGDILCVFSNRRIKCANAGNYCNPWDHVKNVNGYLDNDTLPYFFYEKVSQYRMEKIGNTVKRITIATSLEEDASGERDWKDYIKKRLVAWKNKDTRNGKPFFGTPGNEIWYDGSLDQTEATIDLLITDIKNNSEKTDADFVYFPAQHKDLKYHLGLAINNPTELEAAALVASDIDMTDPRKPVLIRKRNNMVSWQDITEISGSTQARISDNTVSVNLRNNGEHTRTDIVVEK